MAYQPPNIYSVHGISSAGAHTHHPIHERTNERGYSATGDYKSMAAVASSEEPTHAVKLVPPLWVEFPLLRTPPRLPSVTPTRLSAQNSKTRSAHRDMNLLIFA